MFYLDVPEIVLQTLLDLFLIQKFALSVSFLPPICLISLSQAIPSSSPVFRHTYHHLQLPKMTGGCRGPGARTSSPVGYK